MADYNIFLKGVVSQNRNIFTLTVKTATKLLALRVTWKYEKIILWIKASTDTTTAST